MDVELGETDGVAGARVWPTEAVRKHVGVQGIAAAEFGEVVLEGARVVGEVARLDYEGRWWLVRGGSKLLWRLIALGRL